MSHKEIRKNPFTNEWIIYSEARQARPDRKEDFCPLCSGSPEVPEFIEPIRIPNKFPALEIGNDPKKISSGEFRTKMSNYGKCELVVYTNIHDAKFIDLSNEEIFQIFQKWMEATKEYSLDKNIKYILPFENYGEDVGATLIHPHGQIYGFPMIPKEIEKELDAVKQFNKKNNSCMFCNYIEEEQERDERIVFQDNNLIALIPYFARHAYDVFVYPKRHVNFLHQCTRTEMDSFISTIKQIIVSLNNVFEKDVSYSLSLHQSPLNTQGSNMFHLYFKIHTPQRNTKSLKLLGAVETSTKTYINGMLPETAANILREKMS
ncbi:MAG: Galactose-1-phosphate uridylyltransferase [Candidatus Heimdallarchaeota archaeon AB_125]|nr:MAG: Galactose-1-phosphate uridylyltransferase [Candidatus Heimdallarchaeota archaeon AB_125]